MMNNTRVRWEPVTRILQDVTAKLNATYKTTSGAATSASSFNLAPISSLTFQYFRAYYFLLFALHQHDDVFSWAGHCQDRLYNCKYGELVFTKRLP